MLWRGHLKQAFKLQNFLRMGSLNSCQHRQMVNYKHMKVDLFEVFRMSKDNLFKVFRVSKLLTAARSFEFPW